MANLPRIPKWLFIGLASACAGVIVCLTIGFSTGARGNDTLLMLSACALPFALLTTFIAFLAIAGKGAKRRCGFCGYDRQGFALEAPCSECGKPGNAQNAPLHKAVGNRPLPYWIWVPAALAVPGAIFVGYLFRRADMVFATAAVLPVAFIAGMVWSWMQARER